MDKFTADFRQASNIDLTKLTLRPVTAIPKRPVSPFERTALEAALGLGKSLDPKLGLMEEVAKIGDKPPTVSLLRPTPRPRGFALSSSTQLTVALGATAAAFALWGSGISGGVYGSTTREVGIFFTYGSGLFLPAIGASAGGELSFIFGTPADFKGPYLSAGASVSSPSFPVSIAVGAQLLFAPGPPLTLMGYSLSLTTNTPSILPVTVTLEMTNTLAKPLLRF